jgi:hypothetical protein
MNPEEREEMRRQFGVLVEDVRSDLRLVAEGNAMTTESLQRLSDKVDSFRDETAREFALERAEVASIRADVAAVRSEAAAFRDETNLNFAAVRAEMSSGRTGIPLPRRSRTRRRPN